MEVGTRKLDRYALSPVTLTTPARSIFGMELFLDRVVIFGVDPAEKLEEP